MELDASNPDALVSMARSLIEMGNFSQAAVYLQTCLHVAPEYQQAYAHYGLLMDKLGELFSFFFLNEKVFLRRINTVYIT